MRVKVQQIWNGTSQPTHSDGMGFRALVCGGIIVYARDWNRRTAKLMLDALEAEGLRRASIRFYHV